MIAPKRLLASLDDESAPSWFITTDGGRTFERAIGDRIRVRAEDLIAHPHGLNDPELLNNWPRSRKAAFRPARTA